MYHLITEGMVLTTIGTTTMAWHRHQESRNVRIQLAEKEKQAAQLDKEYNESRRDVPFLTDKPSTYIKQMYFATQPIEEPENGKDLVEMMRMFDGENQVLFASDWPHHDFDHPRQVFDLPFSPQAKRKIMGENALKLFGIPAPVKAAAHEGKA